MKLSLGPMAITFAASFALVRGLASCAEGAPHAGNKSALLDPTPPDAAPPETLPEAGSPSRCTVDSWCLVDIGKDPISLNGVWGSSANDVWIVASPDAVLHWDGTSITKSKAGTFQTLFGVWGSGPNDVWAFSSGDGLWHSTGFADGGVEWSHADYTDAGDTIVFHSALSAIWGRSANDVWAVGPFAGEPTVLHADGWGTSGPSWSPTPTSNADPPELEALGFNAIWGSAAGEIWIAGMGGKTRHASIPTPGDHQAKWDSVNSNTSFDLYAVWGTGADVWVAGAGGIMRRFARASDGTWTATEVELPTTETIQSLFGFAANDIWAAGTGGTLLHFDGTTWSPADIGLAPDAAKADRDLYAIWGSSSDDLWVVGTSTLLHKGASNLSLPRSP